MANDILKITERCLDISSLDIPYYFFFAQGEMKNESWVGGGKYSKKCFI